MSRHDFTVCVVFCLSAMPLLLCYKAQEKSEHISFPDELPANRQQQQQQHHYHHLHHNPDFHHDPDFHDRNPQLPHPIQHHHHRPSEQEEQSTSSTVIDGSNFRDEAPYKSKQIPIAYIQNLMQHNVTDLLLNFVDDIQETNTFLHDRFGEDGDERNAAIMPKAAGCIPELKTVRIANSDDASILYIPQCTRIERCGGCCSHPLLACQANQTEMVNFKILKTKYTGAQKLKLISKEIVQVEKHTKCVCGCKVQPENCSKFQVYNKNECRCACANYDEEKKCFKSNATKLWNPELCTCQCREQMQCSTGSVFDSNQCKCVVSQMRRRYVKAPVTELLEDVSVESFLN